MVSEMEMVSELETDQIDDMEIEVLPSMWPDDIGKDIGKQFNVEQPGSDQDMLEEVTIQTGPNIVDYKHLYQLNDYTDQGSSQLAYLMKQWEYKQANAVRLLREELDIVSRQKEEAEIKELKILEEHRFEEDVDHKRPISILEEVYEVLPNIRRKKEDAVVKSKLFQIDAEYDDTVAYWKKKSLYFETLLESSIQREQVLVEKLQESVKALEKQISPVEEMSQILKRADNFLHFVLQNAPVVIGHQDKDLRYRFIYNKYPDLQEQEILGKTDVEIFTGAGVKESQDFKREVLEKGIPAKREITFETELFGSKTFLIYVEPVFSKTKETIGINYMGMEVTDQVRKREKMIKLREEIAVRKAKETELNKTIHITEETMRAKQMLATMSHEIRSPLSGVVSMAEILTTTKLDKEQRQLLNVMISSGDLVLQLINDILDLSKVESGVMKLEATNFRPREVVKHVLQTAAASLKKVLTLEGDVADDVPHEVIGDVLRIRQILTNLISNAIKFTHKGKVGIKLYVVPEPPFAKEGLQQLKSALDQSSSNTSKEEKHTSASQTNGDHNQVSSNTSKEEKYTSASQINGDHKAFDSPKKGDMHYQNHSIKNDSSTAQIRNSINGDTEGQVEVLETTVWIRCDVHDTGIGIPENGLPTLFKKYMQVSADHARKYGGTGLGLAICKQLVELMGGQLTVYSQVNCGSTFTFILPYKVSTTSDHSDDSDELSDMTSHDDETEDVTEGFFQFLPRTSLFSPNKSILSQQRLPHINELQDNSHSLPLNEVRPKGTFSIEEAHSVVGVREPVSGHESSNGHALDSSVRINKDFREDSIVQSQVHSLESRNSVENGVQDSRQIQERYELSSHCTSSGRQEVPEPRTKPKILLVEDNKINITVAKTMMTRLGHSIEVVNNGVEAIRAVQRSNYDLVLMDVFMPIMDGLKATRLIRSFEETGKWDAAVEAGVELDAASSNSSQFGHTRSTRRLPIIAMTANTVSESSEDCYANGMDSFISKPVTFQKLKDCLEEYLI